MCMRLELLDWYQLSLLVGKILNQHKGGSLVTLVLPLL